MGSFVYAGRCKARGDRIAAMISLETIGYFSDAPRSQTYPVAALGAFYPKVGNFIGIVGNVRSRWLVRRAIAQFRRDCSVNGPEAFTPDNEFILGPSEVRGFWVAAGFCAHGLAGAGGMGRLVAEWIVDGRPDSTRGRWTRGGSAGITSAASTRWRARARCTRPTTTSSIPGTSAARGDRFASRRFTRGSPSLVWPLARSRAGNANWFEPNGARGDESLRPRGWAGRLWSPAIGAEHLACRESAAVFDFTSFAKIEVRGRGAASFLEGLTDNRVARAVGALTYTQMLNEGGGIECDFTVTRLADDRFRVITGTAFGQHDLSWIRDHAPEDGSVLVEDVTSAYACIGLWGPAARDILQPLTPTPIGNEAFAFMTAQQLAVGSVPCLALRVTYVGELGWELYCPTEFGLRLWDTLWDYWLVLRLGACGYIASTRCDWRRATASGAPTSVPSPTHTRAALDSASSSTRASSSGARGPLKKKAAPEKTRLACLVLDDPRSVALGSEPVRIAGEVAGRVTSGGYGYTVEKSIAYAYKKPSSAAVGTPVEVEIFGTWVPGEIAKDPLYDPGGFRIRA